ncbi:DUF2911 domain-containing protein [Fulvivirga ligni]|uniref:DUF2911 domain-containing protein n=1 Tax=Fulvivirga ligni TaxID=2904246 RepID=UPI001F202FE1|nr:DUF2911 domain-containing protein [Fulvivirga ligni]UII23609.1 DUF2911 domain-containing protein [Fulvivirga ligni]
MRILTKQLLPVVIFFALIASACGPKGGQEEGTEADSTAADTTTVVEKKEEPIKSPRKQAEGEIGDVSIVVDYGSPAVKERVIWGGLESYDSIWRAGANETTSFEFSKDVTINDTEVKAGKYGFYLIPKESADWVAIINTDWNREEHGAFGAYNYKEEHDVVRVEVAPEWKEDVTERLTYSVIEEGIVLEWEKMKLTIPVSAVAE